MDTKTTQPIYIYIYIYTLYIYIYIRNQNENIDFRDNVIGSRRRADGAHLVGDEVYRTEIEVVLLANFGKLGVQVDLVLLDERLEPSDFVVDDAIVELETPSVAGPAAGR